MGSQLAEGAKSKPGGRAALIFPTRWGGAAATVPRVDLRLDQRRRNIFRRPDVETAAEFAVAQAVEEINAQPDGKPSNKAPPRLQGET